MNHVGGVGYFINVTETRALNSVRLKIVFIDVTTYRYGSLRFAYEKYIGWGEGNFPDNL